MADNVREAPPAVRKIVTAMIEQALSKCDRLGISWEDFRRILNEIRTSTNHSLPLSKAIDLTFKQLAERAN